MSRWCDNCYRKDNPSCTSKCIVFGKHFDELAKTVLEFEEKIKIMNEKCIKD